MEIPNATGSFSHPILLWAEEEKFLGELPPVAVRILEAIQYRVELLRGGIDTLLATGERQSRRTVSAPIDEGVLLSDDTRALSRPTFRRLTGRWIATREI